MPTSLLDSHTLFCKSSDMQDFSYLRDFTNKRCLNGGIRNIPTYKVATYLKMTWHIFSWRTKGFFSRENKRDTIFCKEPFNSFNQIFRKVVHSNTWKCSTSIELHERICNDSCFKGCKISHRLLNENISSLLA